MQPIWKISDRSLQQFGRGESCNPPSRCNHYAFLDVKGEKEILFSAKGRVADLRSGGGLDKLLHSDIIITNSGILKTKGLRDENINVQELKFVGSSLVSETCVLLPEKGVLILLEAAYIANHFISAIAHFSDDRCRLWTISLSFCRSHDAEIILQHCGRVMNNNNHSDVEEPEYSVGGDETFSWTRFTLSTRLDRLIETFNGLQPDYWKPAASSLLIAAYSESLIPKLLSELFASAVLENKRSSKPFSLFLEEVNFATVCIGMYCHAARSSWSDVLFSEFQKKLEVSAGTELDVQKLVEEIFKAIGASDDKKTFPVEVKMVSVHLNYAARAVGETNLHWLIAKMILKPILDRIPKRGTGKKVAEALEVFTLENTTRYGMSVGMKEWSKRILPEVIIIINSISDQSTLPAAETAVVPPGNTKLSQAADLIRRTATLKESGEMARIFSAPPTLGRCLAPLVHIVRQHAFPLLLNCWSLQDTMAEDITRKDRSIDTLRATML